MSPHIAKAYTENKYKVEKEVGISMQWRIQVGFTYFLMATFSYVHVQQILRISDSMSKSYQRNGHCFR